MRARRWIAGALFCVLGAGCMKDARAPEWGMPGLPPGEYASDAAQAAPAPPPGPMEESGGSKSAGHFSPENAKTPSDTVAPGQPSGGPGIDDPSRKQPILIYRADFNLSVYEVEKSLNAIEGIAKEAGGYLARRDDRTITIRVPAQKFNDIVASIEKVGDVLHRNVVSEDVTAEYRDLEVQLQNQMAMRDRFTKLLEKAQKVEEALAIEKELGRITGEIERIKGRLKLLTDLARYSTITVSFEPRSSEKVQQGPFVLPLPWLNQVGLRRLMSL